MARQVSPGTPSETPVLNIKTPKVNLEMFDAIGDAKIKSATENFKLYAETSYKVKAQELYEKYIDNPMALTEALEKLPQMYSDIPDEALKNELNSKIMLDSISLIAKAKANQEKAIDLQNKQLAKANADLSLNQLSDDYFNVLKYMTAPEEEKRSIDLDIYKDHRKTLSTLLSMKDAEGNEIFSESQRKNMAMPKDAVVNGFKQFINRMEEKQLTEWDKTYFQNRDKFKQDTDIDDETYESMETYLKQRMKALQDDKNRKIHGQAYYDQLSLISEPTEINIQKAKSYDFTNDRAIDKLVEAAKKTTLEKYYDPTRKTSPGAFMEAYALFAEAVSNPDWSYEGREQALTSATDAMVYLEALAQETNLDPKYTNQIKQMIQKALSNKEAQQALLDSEFANVNTYANVKPRKTFFTESLQDSIQETAQSSRETAQGMVFQTAEEKARDFAERRYMNNISNAGMAYLSGDMEKFKASTEAAAKQYKKDIASFIVKSDSEWERLENALAEGKPAVINYMGRNYNFAGFDNKGAIFKEIM